MNQKSISIILLIAGSALLLGAVAFWIDNLTTPKSVGLATWILDIFIALIGAGAGIKGWMTLYRKEDSANRNIASDGGQIAGEGGRNIQVKESGQYIEQYNHYELSMIGSSPAVIHQLPPAPSDFTGREQQITDILAEFEQHKGAIISGITGMGGIGKTALGLVIAHRLADQYPDGQIFLDLKGTTTPSSVKQMMLDVITFLEPDVRDVKDENIPAKYQSVLYHKRILFFLDNARSAEQIAPLRPPHTCAMLVTSRWKFSIPGLKAHTLNVLDQQDAVLFLLRLCPRAGKEALDIAKACGYLPLALRIAGSFLEVNEDWSIEKYLNELKNRRRRLPAFRFSRELSGLHSEPDILAAFELSYQQLDVADRQHWNKLGEFLASFTVDAAAFHWVMEKDIAQTLLAVFRRYSLLDYDAITGLYSLHDLLIDYANLQSEQEKKRGQVKLLQVGANRYRDTALPQVHLLSNGDYSVIITATGSGYSRWREVNLTRWQADPTLDNLGKWIYIKDLESKQLWSAAFQPVAIQSASHEVTFYPHTVEFRRQDNDISTRMTIAVTPGADVEIRHLVISNNSRARRELALTSYAEIILSAEQTDMTNAVRMQESIGCEYLPKENCLLFKTTPGPENDKDIYLAHFAVDDSGRALTISYETNRDKFIGRGQTSRNPLALQIDSPLSNSSSAIDPVCAMQVHFFLSASETRHIAFVTLAAASRKEALNLVDRYRQWQHVNAVFSEAADQAEREFNVTGLSSAQLEEYQELLSMLLYPSATLRAQSELLALNTLDLTGLSKFSIDGDYPLLLVHIGQEKDLVMLEQLLLAHAYWRRRRMTIGLAILHHRNIASGQDLNSQIYSVVIRTSSENWIDKYGGIFLLDGEQMSKGEQILLATRARVVLDARAGTLKDYLERSHQLPVRLPRFVPIEEPLAREKQNPKQSLDLLGNADLGDFTLDGREYIINLEPEQWTSVPLVNLIINAHFGFLVSESSLGSTWALNSSENRLTTWHNDVVCDPPSEAIYLRDEDTGELWSPTPLPARADMPYLVRHGIGYSIFEHNSHRLHHRLRLFAAIEAPLKFAQLMLENKSQGVRRVSVTYYAEWVLGKTRQNTMQYILPEYDSGNNAVLACNPCNHPFGSRMAFLACTREPNGLTTDRTEFLGSVGSYAHPASLDRVGLTPRVEPGIDPCAAMSVQLWLSPGESKEVTFLLGQAENRGATQRLITEYQSDIAKIEKTRGDVAIYWNNVLEHKVKNNSGYARFVAKPWLMSQLSACDSLMDNEEIIFYRQQIEKLASKA